MHRIIRTVLASLGAAVVVAGGSLGVAYATAPAPDSAPTPSANDSDQVSALDKSANDLLAKIATLEKELATMPAAPPEDSALTKQELVEPPAPAAAPTSRRATATASSPATSSAATTAPTTDEKDPQTEDETDD